MATRFQLEVNLDDAAIASVEDLAQLLRHAADQLGRQCGTDCEFSPKCARCWSDLKFVRADGTPVGAGRIIVD
ncbi:MAG: hypothetical protein U0704_04740 [Candidatus Eisenbacteria bacterium]